MVAVRDRAERQPTAERVAEVAAQFVRRDVSRLVPDSGMTVVGATPYAEVPAECAAVDGGLVRTLDGVSATGGVRFGADTRGATVLLAAREVEADLRFAVTCRFDETVEAALAAVDGPVARVDPDETAGRDGLTERAARAAVADAPETPAALVDAGAVGREATVTLLAPDTATLTDRTVTLLDAVADREQ
jgi:hydroxymethylpyrimidine/phosphomethylpyrimidine kinase